MKNTMLLANKIYYNKALLFHFAKNLNTFVNRN